MKRNPFPAHFATTLLLVLSVAPSHSQEQGRGQQQQVPDRALLFSKAPTEAFQKVVALLRSPATPTTEPKQLTWSTPYFVRVAPRAVTLGPAGALADSAIPGQSDAILGTRPFVFLSSAESLSGRSLLDIYQDIGYEAEDILRFQLNQDMVAIVFRYPDEIKPSPEITDGKLPPDWNQRVYVPHWDNAFALFHRLAQDATIEPNKSGEFAPLRLFFKSEQEKAFALKVSRGINPRLKRFSYITLKARGGPDWRYRKLLENKLSLFEHFRGTGRTQNEVADPDGQLDGLVEFVGPNFKLKDLPELAVIDLGRLTVSNTFVPLTSVGTTP